MGTYHFGSALGECILLDQEDVEADDCSSHAHKPAPVDTSEALLAVLREAVQDAQDYRANEGECGDCEDDEPCIDHQNDAARAEAYGAALAALTKPTHLFRTER